MSITSVTDRKKFLIFLDLISRCQKISIDICLGYRLSYLKFTDITFHQRQIFFSGIQGF